MNHERPEERFEELRPASPPPAVDLDRLIEGEPAQARGRSGLWVGLGLGLAAAAASLFVVLPDDELLERGPGSAGNEVELRLYVEVDPPRRLGRGEPQEVGDRLIFEVASERQARIHLWIEGPEGGPVGSLEVDAAPRMLPAPNGLMAWQFSEKGDYTVYASEDPAACLESGCDRWSLEVR
jgi:hypothetical protein